MDYVRSPFDSFLNIISALPQGHEKPLKHALYNALAMLLLFLSCAAGWALYIILGPFIKPLMWAVLVGSVLHPIKHSIAAILRSWFNHLDAHGTPICLGVCVLPFNIINNVSEMIGSKIVNHIKVLGSITVLIPLVHCTYYYTPETLLNFAFNSALSTHTVVSWMISQINFTVILLALLFYLSYVYLYWSAEASTKFQYASVGIWILISGYLAHFAGSLQVLLFVILQMMFIAGFIVEVRSMQQEMHDYGQDISLLESILWAVTNRTPPKKSCDKVEEVIGDAAHKKDDKEVEEAPIVAKVHNLRRKTQRSLSQPGPERVGVFHRTLFGGNYLNTFHAEEQTAILHGKSYYLESDFYIYGVLWACVVMTLWKHSSLLPILPLPILIYVIKHLGHYFGVWDWCVGKLSGVLDVVHGWCKERQQALVPLPVRGLYKGMLRANSGLQTVARESIDTVSSVVVITGLIVFMTCASIFIAVQIYSEAIMLVQVTGNVINSTVVHNPELRQILPPGWEDTVDSILDNAYTYGREGISKLIRGMVNDADSPKTLDLEKQVLELWDRVYQTWMTSSEKMGPVVSSEAVQHSWQSFIHNVKKQTDLFNFSGLIEFLKQNIGTLMTLLESVWSILVGNITLILGSFSALISIVLGGGTAVLNFILNAVVFFTTLFYLLSCSGNLYKPVDIITNFSPHNGNRFGVALESAINGVFKASLKMTVFYGMWTWFIHNLFGVQIVYLPTALAAILGAIPFLGTYWACIPAVLDLWLAQGCGVKAILLACFQFLPTSFVDTAIYKEIKGGGHPYLTGLAIAGGIFCLGVEGAIIGPLLLCGLYVAIDLSSTIFRETPSDEAIPMQMQHLARNVI